MPQLQLPMFPIGVTPVTADLAFKNEEGNITYFYGSLPVFSHPEDNGVRNILVGDCTCQIIR